MRSASAAALALLLSACSGGYHTSICWAIDGDTLKCANGERLRLNGIDAPELDTFAGKVSLLSLQAAVDKQPITYYVHKRDRYGRLVVSAHSVLGFDLSCYQVAVGNARYVRKWDEQLATAQCLQ